MEYYDFGDYDDHASNTTYRDCPICGAEESFEFTLHHDVQGEPPWTGDLYWYECVKQECSCELTPEQEDALYAEVTTS